MCRVISQQRGCRCFLCLVAGSLFALEAAMASPDRIAMTVSVEGSEEKPSSTIESTVSFPGMCTFFLHAPTSSWINVSTLEFDLIWPEKASTNAQVLLHMKDWDYFWYQTLLPGYLLPGKRNHFQVELSPSANSWTGRGHHGSWHLRALMEPKEFGIRVFCDEPYKGTCKLEKIFGIPWNEDTAPPFIRNVRANTTRVPCFEKFELTFELPDRYPDPFDANQIYVAADFETPDGETIRIDGFYSQDYYRKTDMTGARIIPQGSPYWRVRFTPTKQGKYKYTLKVRDARGETNRGAAIFLAIAPKLPGFVRVSKADPRYFEFDNGSCYFPIGHNIRSPFDARMDKQFPWVQRWQEGSSAYVRYFNTMRKHGENFTEIWSAPWSLGLEWSPQHYGYHGVGQFNMINAWEMDRVVDEAELNGIYLNLTIHNHGKFSTYSDQEWENNPFNVKNGGYLEKPEEYFTDPRALKSFRKLMRYMITRWGYSTRIFAWQLWSELDLTGSQHEYHKNPAVVDWHRLMGKAVKDMDPYDHMVSTHVSGDYTVQNKAIISLPEIDLCPVDAYHGSPDPLHIVTLMRQTANYNNPLGKPVLITEFGGTSSAQRLKHLEETLHAALWASACIPLGGTPLFWWWQLVEEENFYPKYDAISKFLKSEDMRDPELQMYTPELLIDGAEAGHLAAQCLKNRNRALGWIYHSEDFSSVDLQGNTMVTNLTLRMKDMCDGNFYVEFWNTIAGRPVAKISVQTENKVLIVNVPGFIRDIAFKIRTQKQELRDQTGKIQRR